VVQASNREVRETDLKSQVKTEQLSEAWQSLPLQRIAIEACEDELRDKTVYARLARSFENKNHNHNQIFTQLADTEEKHYTFWRKYCPNTENKPSKIRIWLVLYLRFLFGTTFAIKLLERHEAKDIEKFTSIARMIPTEDKPKFDEMLEDELSHEKGFRDQIESSYVKYLSFVVLGLADAIVEISGIHAGSLGIFNSTEITGLAGVVAGAAASIAMASAAYAQARQGFLGSASVSAFFTGVSYFISAVILASPYFITKEMVVAMATSLVLAAFIVAVTTYYNSVISERRFLKDFLPLIGIMLVATAALYVFGNVVRLFTGIGG
jgi:VIT1/CCC1 family predicted Fe2+/Mn2+ transporter